LLGIVLNVSSSTYSLFYVFGFVPIVFVHSFGYNYSWGVFLNYYNKHVYVDQLSTLSWIGSICVALFFFLGPINRLVIEKMGYRNMLLVGTVACPLALILASFATQVWHVFLTQGVLFGLGASFVWFPCIGASQQWFSQRRGLAIGLAMSGSGIGGLVVSNIAQAAISSVGYRWALRIIGIMTFLLLIVTTATVRPLGNIKQTGGRDKIIAWYLFKNPQFCVLFLQGLITTFGYMVGYSFEQC
jgi:MFS family permease